MLNPAHEVHQAHEAQNVHELLLSTVKQVRALHPTLSPLMTDVAAIRRTFLQGRGYMVHYKTICAQQLKPPSRLWKRRCSPTMR